MELKAIDTLIESAITHPDSCSNPFLESTSAWFARLIDDCSNQLVSKDISLLIPRLIPIVPEAKQAEDIEKAGLQSLVEYIRHQYPQTFRLSHLILALVNVNKSVIYVIHKHLSEHHLLPSSGTSRFFDKVVHFSGRLNDLRRVSSVQISPSGPPLLPDSRANLLASNLSQATETIRSMSDPPPFATYLRAYSLSSDSSSFSTSPKVPPTILTETSMSRSRICAPRPTPVTELQIFADLNEQDNRLIMKRMKSASIIWFSAHTGYNCMISQYHAAVRTAIERGCFLRVVVSNPNGLIVRNAELARRLCPSIRQAGEIKDVIRACINHRRAAVKARYSPENIQIRLYDGVPSMNILRVDNWLRVIPYLPLIDAADSPVLEFSFDERPHPIVSKYLRALDLLWENAKPALLVDGDE